MFQSEERSTVILVDTNRSLNRKPYRIKELQFAFLWLSLPEIVKRKTYLLYIIHSSDYILFLTVEIRWYILRNQKCRIGRDLNSKSLFF